MDSQPKEVCPPVAFADVADQLMPLLKDRAFLPCYRLLQEVDLGPPPAPEPVFVPIVAELGACIALDQVKPLTLVTVPDLQRWGMNAETVLTRALQNLAKRCTDWQVVVHREAGMVSEQSAYDSARILLTERLLEATNLRPLVAMVPNESLVNVSSAQSVAGLTRLLELAHDALYDGGAAGERLVSPHPLVFSEDRWQLCTLPEQLVVHYAQLQMIYHSRNLATQGRWLTRWIERHAPAFAAAIGRTRVMRLSASGPMRIVSEWSDKTLPLLLPEADTVIFMNERKHRGHWAPWENVRRELGHCMTPIPGLRPPRWRVTEFPEKRELAAMEAQEVRDPFRAARMVVATVNES